MSASETQKPRIKQLKLEMDKIIDGEFDSGKVRDQLSKRVGEEKTQRIFSEFQNSSDKSYHNLVQITSNALSDNSSKTPLMDKELLNYTSSHRRYKKGFSSINEEAQKEKMACQSPISKLSEKIGKYMLDDVSSEDFYRVLLKNNIDPESKQVKKIIKELDIDTSNSHHKAISSLLKVKDCPATEEEELERKALRSPLKQTMTSFQDSSFKADLEITSSKKRKVEATARPSNIFPTGDDTAKISKQINNKTNTSSNSLCPTSRSRKIEFMSESNIFKKTPEVDPEKIEKKFYTSILQNYSSKQTFSHSSKIDVVPKIHSARSGLKNKNQVSEENLAAITQKPKKEDAGVKIIGMYGKARNPNTILEVDQRRSSYAEIFCSNPKKKSSRSQHDESSKPQVSSPKPQSKDSGLQIEDNSRKSSGTALFQKLVKTPNEIKSPKQSS